MSSADYGRGRARRRAHNLHGLAVPGGQCGTFLSFLEKPRLSIAAERTCRRSRSISSPDDEYVLVLMDAADLLKGSVAGRQSPCSTVSIFFPFMLGRRAGALREPLRSTWSSSKREASQSWPACAMS